MDKKNSVAVPILLFVLMAVGAAIGLTYLMEKNKKKDAEIASADDQNK